MKIYCSILLFILSSKLFAQESIVAVGDATVEKTKLSFSAEEDCNCINVTNIVRSDLSLYSHKIQMFDSDLAEIEQFDYEFKLSKITVDKKFQLNFKSRTSPDEKVFFDDNSDLDARKISHEISDFIFKKIFQKDSIFKSKIYYISDAGINKNGKKGKQLFVMDFDGENIKQLTFHNGYVFSPGISSDGKLAVYSVILNDGDKKNVDLYLLDIEKKESKILSNFKGINSGAVFMPGDKEIILTLTHSGNAELYKLNLESKNLFPLTRHFSSDVDPSISSDGKMVTFLSTRPGKPMIYTLNPEKTEFEIKRISYVGEYNATPRFSPDGKIIVFSSWLDNQFDLFRLDRSGMNLVRLTKDHGSNEEPSFSPDGEFIVFSSQKILSETQDVKNLYIMTQDGEIIRKLSSILGKAEAPVWSK